MLAADKMETACKGFFIKGFFYASMKKPKRFLKTDSQNYV